MPRPIWLLPILLVLAVGWYVLAPDSAPPESPGRGIAYSDLVAEISKGTIRDIVIRGRAASGLSKDGLPFTTILPTEPDKLVELALAAGTRVVARPADTEPNPLLHYFLAWAPFLLWLWAFRAIGLRLIDRAAAAQSARIAQLEARLAVLEAGPR